MDPKAEEFVARFTGEGCHSTRAILLAGKEADFSTETWIEVHKRACVLPRTQRLRSASMTLLLGSKTLQGAIAAVEYAKNQPYHKEAFEKLATFDATTEEQIKLFLQSRSAKARTIGEYHEARRKKAEKW